MDRDERKVRRFQIAELAASKGSFAAQNYFEISGQTVLNSCKEFGIKPLARAHYKDYYKNSVKTFSILADLINTNLTTYQIADKFSCSHQYVSQIAKNAIECGIRLHQERV